MLVRFDKQERLYKAIKLVRPIHLNVHRSIEHMLEGSGISVAERAVLELLCVEPLTVPEAARRLSMKRQFVLRVVVGLLEKGLLEKHPTRNIDAPISVRRALSVATCSRPSTGANSNCCTRFWAISTRPKWLRHSGS